VNPAIRVSRIMVVVSLALLCAAIASLALIPGEPIIGALFLIAALGSGTNAVIFLRARNRRPTASQPPASSRGGLQFVPDDLLAIGAGRPIPWHGGTGILTVKRPAFGKTASILVDGRVIALPARAIIANPWVECAIRGTDPELVIVQVQQERYVFRVLVFANGISLSDGSTLDASRMRKPVALDEFEQVFRPPAFGIPGAIGLGLICFLGALSGNNVDHGIGPASVVFLALAFAIPSGWMLLTVALVRWLRTKRSWSWRLRRMTVVGFFLGIPIATIAVLVSAFGSTK
jgi:hypothetical protein